MPFFYYLDPTYILVIIAMVLSLVASARVNSAFSKYSRVMAAGGLTGAEAAQRLLHSAGIYDVAVISVSGNLTDHYNPAKKTLALSESVYGSRSVAAIGVAAHECGHAMQHAHGYAPLKIRTAIVPVVNVATTISWPMIFLGVIMGFSQTLITMGIILFSASVLFQLITLPVEFNASRRALIALEDGGILYGDEVKQSGKVLKAAALTYVAAAAGSILQLLRLLILFGGRRRD
ncbi:zinc metallopeptidase [Anaerolentibacter hominis]|uniref:zinc metallopeptidase n=1 Tax=Anaerolentibacter hominis TaxID=3079009 RepID=UPI0031B80A71